jgi:amino acid transporter
MDRSGIVVWLIEGAVLAAVVLAGAAQFRGLKPRAIWKSVVPAAFLGTYMGSQSFTWLCAKGPEYGGYYFLTSLLFGVVLAWLALQASTARPPVPSESEDM